ncbi:hypothetical protein, partial [Xenorhabdus japonica]|uniref:hypothetical protein n=1 Tax=Xenorhabdus japonica TaxID=53341 RepID=UPI001C315343
MKSACWRNFGFCVVGDVYVLGNTFLPVDALSLSHISTSTDLASKYPSISVCSRNQPSHSL